MKKMKRLWTKAMTITAIGGFTTLLSGCNMMETDLSACPMGLYVHFKYDYNIERADMFADHVGSVTVYVFDENGKFVTQKEESNTAESKPLKSKDFCVHFADGELPEGTYQILALAQQKSYTECLATNGAKFRRTELQPGEPMENLRIRLDREAVTADGTANVPHEGMPLDTLFATLKDTGKGPKLLPVDTVTLKKGYEVRDTLELIRDTKQIHISLRQTEDPASMAAERYDVCIIDRNGTLLFDNETDATDDLLHYSPFSIWDTEYETHAAPSARAEEGETNHIGRTAHFQLSTSRLVNRTPATDNARLIITSRETGEKVVDVNLPALLNDARNYYDQFMPLQEFLDREYRYNLDFFLAGGRWTYVNISIGVLSWSVRVQNVVLE